MASQVAEMVLVEHYISILLFKVKKNGSCALEEAVILMEAYASSQRPRRDKLGIHLQGGP